MSEIPEEEFKIKYQEASDPMHKKVQKAVEENGQDFWVYYSAYEDKDGIPIDNLNEIPVPGKVMFVEQGDTFYGSGKSYRSKILDSPTWLEICVVANEMIIATKDMHHIYLEAVHATPKTLFQDNDEVKILRFSMGS